MPKGLSQAMSWWIAIGRVERVIGEPTVDDRPSPAAMWLVRSATEDIRAMDIVTIDIGDWIGRADWF